MYLFILFKIILFTSFIFCQEIDEDSQEIEKDSIFSELEIKQEMQTWSNKYPKSIAFGFGTSNPINNNLNEYNKNGTSSNKRFYLQFNNFYNLNLLNKEIQLSLIGETENFYLLNFINIWTIFNYQELNTFNIGGGFGTNIVLYNFEQEETAYGLIFDLNTSIPLNMNNIDPIIGFNLKHILTKFDNIDLLGPYDSQIYNFYISLAIPLQLLIKKY